MKQNPVKMTTQKVDSIYLEQSVKNVIEELNRLVDTIPYEHKESAFIDKECGYDDCHYYYVKYERPCTKEELAEIEAQNDKQKEWEINQLKVLLKKYPKID